MSTLDKVLQLLQNVSVPAKFASSSLNFVLNASVLQGLESVCFKLDENFYENSRPKNFILMVTFVTHGSFLKLAFNFIHNATNVFIRDFLIAK